MYKVAVVGAGQLGRRHVQGLLQVSFPLQIYLIDPSRQALSKAEEFVVSLQKQRKRHEVIFFRTIKELPEKLDLIIVATTANVRLAVLSELVLWCEVDYLILEKVLFQREKDYQEAAKLISKHGIQCWVNCPRRVFSSYNQIKEFFFDDKVHYLNVHGGDWGLACNAIHFLDLMAFFVQNEKFHFDPYYLDPKACSSKRGGFREVTGVLNGRLGTASFSLSSIRQQSLKHLIIIRAMKKMVLIDESAGTILFKSDEDTLAKFDVPFQSELTGLVAEEILTKGVCGLTSYSESMAIHLPFLRALQHVESVMEDDVYHIT